MLTLTLLGIAAGYASADPPIRRSAADQAVLVTVDWLAEHLKDPDLVIFQIGDGASKRTYEAGHIPGAQFLNPFSELAAPQGGASVLALELPQVAQLDSVLEAKGVSNSSRIVLYSADQYFSPTSRAFHSPSKPTCATISPSACSPCRARTSCGYMPRRAPPASPPWSAIPAPTSICGPP